MKKFSVFQDCPPQWHPLTNTMLTPWKIAFNLDFAPSWFAPYHNTCQVQVVEIPVIVAVINEFGILDAGECILTNFYVISLRSGIYCELR